MSWKNQIPGCFGDQDQKFAGHRNDEDRAFKLLSSLRNERVGWSVVRQAFIDHLERNAQWEPHRQEQIKKVEKYFKPWLDD